MMTAWFWVSVGFALGVGATFYYYRWRAQWPDDVSEKQGSISYKEACPHGYVAGCSNVYCAGTTQGREEPAETAESVIEELESMSVMKRRQSDNPLWLKEVGEILDDASSRD